MDGFEAMCTLVAAIDGGRLSAAWPSLNLPLPTVSRRVSDLKAMLGSRLVTEACTGFVASARRVQEELTEAERAAAGQNRALRGELPVTAPVLFESSMSHRSHTNFCALIARFPRS